ncbi:MAG: radical SAM-associated putative lipoprotein [Prevotellaceae bacterium]|jgi:putative lipoprotein (rSAM/lipoprotein system)|nr:radical SAM-associated putative lipoprotein [Prevotellaceae bacterium]
MKKTISFYSKILAGLLGLLGFTYCSLPTPTYGMPPDEHKIIGTVTDKETGEPIENIAFIDKQMAWGTTVLDADTIYADANGQVKFWCNGNLYLDVKDLDGETNGLYNDTSIVMEYSDIPFVFKGENQYGTEIYEAELDVQLTPKK